MRSVAAPAMTKDACSWGALVGTTSALLASRGFTALPSVFAESAVADLGERWHVLDMYVKQYPCCRWTQPAIEAALALAATNGLDPAAIERIEIRSAGPSPWRLRTVASGSRTSKSRRSPTRAVVR
jgi:2-methylcitrate dehydratase PrpD